MEKLKQIASWLQKRGITLYIVGGACRDEIMGLPVEDYDICVVGGGSAYTILLKLLTLKSAGVINDATQVHGSFPIWIVEIEGEKYEFAMARKEKKVGQTRQEFECEVNNVTIEEDLMRRDLTINAIAKNIVTGEIVDPHRALLDIAFKIAHPVSEAFAEDTLRVYRAARFIARFDLNPSEDLVKMCKELNPSDISNERVGMELYKMFEQAKTPSKFFYFLKEIGWLEYHFPELYALIGVPQSPLHHPEGDAFTHTMYCIDAAQGWFYRAVLLCHDLGKATTTVINNLHSWSDPNTQYFYRSDSPIEKKVTAHGHEQAGVELTKTMLKRIHFSSHDVIDRIACLVELHMIRAVINKDNHEKIVRRTLRKLMKHGLSWLDIVSVVYYDLCGRPPKPQPSIEYVAWEIYSVGAMNILATGQMEPIVTGKKLLELGMEPGKEMGEIIKHALQLQDRGTLKHDNWQKVLKGAGYKFFNKESV